MDAAQQVPSLNFVINIHQTSPFMQRKVFCCCLLWKCIISKRQQLPWRINGRWQPKRMIIICTLPVWKICYLMLSKLNIFIIKDIAEVFFLLTGFQAKSSGKGSLARICRDTHFTYRHCQFVLQNFLLAIRSFVSSKTFQSYDDESHKRMKMLDI